MVLSSRKLAAAFAVASCLLHGVVALSLPADVCNLGVSAEDAAKGLDVVADPQCATGGDGCIDTICRHCNVDAATISTEFPTHPNCADLIQVDTDSSDLTGSGDVDNADGESSGSGGSGYDDPWFAPGGAAPGDAAPDGVGALPDNLTGDSPAGAPPPGAPYYGCPYDTSSGDVAVGIMLVGDQTCRRGGLGCYADVCRFCKFKESPQSAHMVTCERLGYYIYSSVPTPPDFSTVDIVDTREWAATTGCPTPTAPGDYATGTLLVGDKTCSQGGIGCYGNACRFCKFQESPQSKNWVTCESMGYKPAGQPIGTVQDITDSTPPTTNCPYPTTPGDYATGTLLVGDATCSKGGLGCYANACRFCKFQETPQSKDWVTCASMGYTNIGQPIGTVQDITEPPVNPDTGCAYSVSGSEFVAGIRLVGDASCARASADCYKNVCRKCKVKDSAMSMHLRPCSDFGYPRTPKPTPVVSPVRDEKWCLAQLVSVHINGGISAVYDRSCSSGGGAGCFSDECRYCQVALTGRSKFFARCPTSTPQDVIETVAPTPAPVVVDGDAGCKAQLAIGHTQGGISAVFDASCSSTSTAGCFGGTCRYCQATWSDKSKDFLPCSGTTPTQSTAAPVPDVNDPSAVCKAQLATGHIQDGIGAVWDASCSAGSVAGCFGDSLCRYCQNSYSPNSKHYLPCSGSTPPQPVPQPVPSPDINDPSAVCKAQLSVGHVQDGIGAVWDVYCTTGSVVGCFGDSLCRYCQNTYSPNSKDFLPCSGSSPTQLVPIPGPSPVVGDSDLACKAQLAVGHIEGGISAVYDATCLVTSVVGCFGGTCRYCQSTWSHTSKNFVPCPTPSLQPVLAPGDAVSAPAPEPVVAPLRAAAKELSTRTAATTSSSLDAMLKDKTLRWTIVGAACVGVVAVIALAPSTDESVDASVEKEVAVVESEQLEASCVQEHQV